METIVHGSRQWLDGIENLTDKPNKQKNKQYHSDV
jgi:hypothetical protein